MKNKKTYVFRFLAVMMSVLSLLGVFSETTAFAASNNAVPAAANVAISTNSGWGINMTGRSIQVYDTVDLTTSTGNRQIYNQEGFTIINAYSNYNPWRYEVSYSTPNDPTGRTGFISGVAGVEVNIKRAFGTTITYATNVWYGPDTSSYQRVGSVSSGEIVAALAESGDWVYIEYNTTAGRKRGWCKKNTMLFVNNRVSDVPAGAKGENYDASFGYKTVYAGPGNQYATVGQIGTNNQLESVHVLATYKFTGITWICIRYSTSNGYKMGYIQI